MVVHLILDTVVFNPSIKGETVPRTIFVRDPKPWSLLGSAVLGLNLAERFPGKIMCRGSENLFLWSGFDGLLYIVTNASKLLSGAAACSNGF